MNPIRTQLEFSKLLKSLVCAFAIVSFIIAESATAVQEPMKDETQEAKDDKLYFSFAGSKWSDVIDWLAKSGGLALHVNEIPKGTFTYADDNGFTLQQAIDRINLFLLPEGFTLVRSGRLLSVINLSDPKSAKQLDTLARLVTPEELDKLEDHDMVKCLFPLGELKADEAVEELVSLNLLKTPDVFSRTNQILVTDTAAKLKLAKKILSLSGRSMLQPRSSSRISSALFREYISHPD